MCSDMPEILYSRSPVTSDLGRIQDINSSRTKTTQNLTAMVWFMNDGNYFIGEIAVLTFILGCVTNNLDLNLFPT